MPPPESPKADANQFFSDVLNWEPDPERDTYPENLLGTSAWMDTLVPSTGVFGGDPVPEPLPTTAGDVAGFFSDVLGVSAADEDIRRIYEASNRLLGTQRESPSMGALEIREIQEGIAFLQQYTATAEKAGTVKWEEASREERQSMFNEYRRGQGLAPRTMRYKSPSSMGRYHSDPEMRTSGLKGLSQDLGTGTLGDLGTRRDAPEWWKGWAADREDTGSMGRLQQAGKTLPFLSAAKDLTFLPQVLASSQRIEDAIDNGKTGSLADWRILLLFAQDQAEVSRGETWGRFAGDVTQMAISFGGELAAMGMGARRLVTEPAKAAAKQGAKKRIRKLIVRAIESKLARKAAKVPILGAIGTTAAVALPLTVGSPHRIVASALRSYIPQTMISEMSSGDLELFMFKDEDYNTIGKALLHATGDTYIELFSEMSGGRLIGAPVSKLLGTIGSKVAGSYGRRITAGGYQAAKPKLINGLIKRYMYIDGLARGKAQSKAMGVLRTMGFHGILEEIGEEYLGDAMRATFEVQGANWDDTYEEWQKKGHFLKQMVGFAPMMAGARGAGAALSGAQRISGSRKRREGLAKGQQIIADRKAEAQDEIDRQQAVAEGPVEGGVSRRVAVEPLSPAALVNERPAAAEQILDILDQEVEEGGVSGKQMLTQHPPRTLDNGEVVYGESILERLTGQKYERGEGRRGKTDKYLDELREHSESQQRQQAAAQVQVEQGEQYKERLEQTQAELQEQIEGAAPEVGQPGLISPESWKRWQSVPEEERTAAEASPAPEKFGAGLGAHQYDHGDIIVDVNTGERLMVIRTEEAVPSADTRVGAPVETTELGYRVLDAETLQDRGVIRESEAKAEEAFEADISKRTRAEEERQALAEAVAREEVRTAGVSAVPPETETAPQDPSRKTPAIVQTLWGGTGKRRVEAELVAPGEFLVEQLDEKGERVPGWAKHAEQMGRQERALIDRMDRQGVKVQLVDTKNPGGLPVNRAGLFHNDTIYLARQYLDYEEGDTLEQAIGKSRRAMQSVFGHEITHYAQRFFPEDARRLYDHLADRDADGVREAFRRWAEDAGLKGDRTLEEIAANDLWRNEAMSTYVENNFADELFWGRVADVGMLGKVRDWFRRVFAKTLGRQVRDPKTGESKWVPASIYREVDDMMARAGRGATEEDVAAAEPMREEFYAAGGALGTKAKPRPALSAGAQQQVKAYKQYGTRPLGTTGPVITPEAMHSQLVLNKPPARYLSPGGVATEVRWEPIVPVLPHGDVEKELATLFTEYSDPTSYQLSQIIGHPKPRERFYTTVMKSDAALQQFTEEAQSRWGDMAKSASSVRKTNEGWHVAKGTRAITVGTTLLDAGVHVPSYSRLKEQLATAFQSDHLLWYQEFGEEASKIVGAENMGEFGVLLAITSARTGVRINFADTLAIMRGVREWEAERLNQGKKGLNRQSAVPLAKAMKNMKRIDGKGLTITGKKAKAIADYYTSGGRLPKWSGLKTTSYNLTVAHRHEGRPVALSVQDVHMARLMGHGRMTIDTSTGGILDMPSIPGSVGSGKAYRYANWLTHRLAIDMGVLPDMVQAGLWFVAKQTMSPLAGKVRKRPPHLADHPRVAEGTVEDALIYGAEETAALKGVINTTTAFVPNTEVSWIENALSGWRITPVVYQQLQRTMEQHAHLGTVSTLPGRKTGATAGLPREKAATRVAAQQRFIDEAVDDNGRFPVLWDVLGLPHRVEQSRGSWDRVVEPGMLITVEDVQIGGVPIAAEIVADVLGFGAWQDATVIESLQRPTEAGPNSNQTMLITLQKEPTTEELEKLRRSLPSHWLYEFTNRGNEITFIYFPDVKHTAKQEKARFTQVSNAIDRHIEKTFGQTYNKSVVFTGSQLRDRKQVNADGTSTGTLGHFLGTWVAGSAGRLTDLATRLGREVGAPLVRAYSPTGRRFSFTQFARQSITGHPGVTQEAQESFVLDYQRGLREGLGYSPWGVPWEGGELAVSGLLSTPGDWERGETRRQEAGEGGAYGTTPGARSNWTVYAAEQDRQALVLNAKATGNDPNVVFHVTTVERAARIMSEGFHVGVTGPNYTAPTLKDHIEGKVFFTEKTGVGAWSAFIPEATEIAVVAIPREQLPDMILDHLGTRDAIGVTFGRNIAKAVIPDLLNRGMKTDVGSLKSIVESESLEDAKAIITESIRRTEDIKIEDAVGINGRDLERRRRKRPGDFVPFAYSVDTSVLPRKTTTNDQQVIDWEQVGREPQDYSEAIYRAELERTPTDAAALARQTAAYGTTPGERGVATRESLEEQFGNRDDAFWGIDYSEEDGSRFASLPDDLAYSGTQCTGYACMIAKKLGVDRVTEFGFGERTGTGGLIEEKLGGHDFAVVDNRFIVDPWLTEVESGRITARTGEVVDVRGRVVFDMQDAADAALIEKLYGDQSKWKRNTEIEASLRKDEKGEGDAYGTTPGERKAARLATPSVDVSERLVSQDITADIYDEERNVAWDERQFLPGAERRVAEDPKGETKKLLDQGLLAIEGSPITISPEEIVTHNLLHNYWYRKAIASEDIEDMKVFRRVVEALRAVRSTWGASGRQMHDPTGGRIAGNYTAPVNPLIRGAVLREAMIEGSDRWRTKMNRARKKLKEAGRTKDKNLERRSRRRIKELETDWEKSYGQLVKFLKKQGVDVDNLDVLSRDAILSQKILSKIASHGSTWTDVRFEFYRNALLSGLTTTGADVIGSGSFGIWKVGVARGIEAFVNSLRLATPGMEINTDEATWAEFKDVILGMKHGIGRAFSNMWNAMITEKPQLQRWIDQDNVTGKFDNLQTAIKNRVLGRAVRGMGYTRLLMADEFFQTMVVYMEIGAQARRMALATENPNTPGENYKTGTKDMADYITAAEKDQRHGAWMKALEVARQITFQSKGGPARQAVKSVGKTITTEGGVVSDWFLQFQMPFMGTPVNIIAESLSYSPVGIFGLAADWVARSKTAEGVPYATERMVVQMLNWAAIMFLVYNNDDEDPILTGANDHLGWNAERTARRVIPSRSVKIPWTEDEEGNSLYAPYDRFEPGSLPITLVTDIANAIRRGETPTEKWLGGLKAPIPSVADTIANKAYLQTLGELQRMATRPEGGPEGMMRKVAKYFARRTAGYVPNLMRHGVKHIGDVEPERRVWGLTDEEFYERLLDRTIQGADLFPYLKPDHERFDAWGYPVEKADELPFMGAWVTRMMFPGRIQREKWFVGDEIITRWNEQNPLDDKHFPYLLDTYVDPKSGKKRSMTNPQMEEAQFTIGTLRRHSMELSAENLTEQDLENPSEDILKIVEQSRSTGSTLGRNLLVAKWHKGLKSMPNLEDAARQRHEELIAYHGKALGRKGPGRWTSAAKRKYKTQEAWAEAVETHAKNLETSRTWLQSRRIPVRAIERAIPRRGTVLRRRLREYSQDMQ